MPLTCPHCGKTNLDLARLCYGCAQPLPGEGPASLLGKTILGNYRLTEVLGQGGMSVVYKAQHRITEQEVAIKILPPDLAVYDDVKARFVGEARTLAKLEHPNIVHLYNFADAEGRLHLVMQYVQGQTFENLIAQKGQVPWPQAASIILAVLDALDYAHARGVVHRDIKPSNILVRADGSVKVMDFGIAKITAGTRLTATGQTMGTVRYMSPEQVRGKELDGRSDLYSLGVTLYEALCGATPYDGETHFEIMQKHLIEPVPALGGRGLEVPAGLERILQRALAKRVEDRYPDALSMRREIAGVLRAHQIADTSAERTLAGLGRARRRLLLAGVGLALVVAASLGGWAVLGGGAARSAGRMAGANPPPAALPGGAPAPAPTGPAPSADAAASAAVPIHWREPHAAARALPFEIDRLYPDTRLHVLSIAPRDPDRLEQVVRAAREAYGRYLTSEKVDLAPNPRPLHLVIVPAAFIRDTTRFPDTSPDASTRYEPPDATLYVADLPNFEREDLPGGLALHFCPVARSVDAEACKRWADGFDRAFKTASTH